jgi:transcriptional regulator with XRE-family HTH domain
MKARELIAKLKENPEFAQAYADLEPQYQIAREIIRLRIERGLTQQDLAARAGTKQANISRLENAVGSPSVALLLRVARALDARLCVELVARERDAAQGVVTASKTSPALPDALAKKSRYGSQMEWSTLRETPETDAGEH